MKIDNARTALRNQERFHHSRTLFVSGERAEESPGRARYASFEPDDADLRDSKKVSRHIDRYRPVHQWSERDVWDIIERHRIFPHPAYRLGWSRCSCAACIFNGKHEFASFRKLRPDQFKQIEVYEVDFGRTVKRKESIAAVADAGEAFRMADEDIRLALSTRWTRSMVLDPWELPAGAFKGGAGPS